MAVSQATLILRVRRLLDDNSFSDLDTAGVAPGGTSVTVADSSKYEIGDFIEWQDDGDVALVTALPDGTHLTVRRSQKGTTASTHAASTVILKNPHFYYNDIADQINRVIKSLWPYAWKGVSLSAITPAPTTTVWYNAAADLIDLVHVTQRYGTVAKVAFYGDTGSGLAVQVERNMPTAVVASGVGIRFPNGFATNDYDVNVTYRAKLTDTLSTGNYSDLSDDTLAEAIIHLAAGQLVAYKEARKATQEDLNAQDRQPGVAMTPASYLLAKGVELRNNHYDYLLRTIPPMRKWDK